MMRLISSLPLCAAWQNHNRAGLRDTRSCDEEMVDKLGLRGVAEVIASFLLPVNILISDDLPTFERPIKSEFRRFR